MNPCVMHTTQALHQLSLKPSPTLPFRSRMSSSKSLCNSPKLKKMTIGNNLIRKRDPMAALSSALWNSAADLEINCSFSHGCSKGNLTII